MFSHQPIKTMLINDLVDLATIKNRLALMLSTEFIVNKILRFSSAELIGKVRTDYDFRYSCGTKWDNIFFLQDVLLKVFLQAEGIHKFTLI